MVSQQLEWTTSSPFRYGVLLPSRARAAEAHNRSLLGSRTLGVEVTDHDLAARCGLGNIDPQHGKLVCYGSAIESALEWPLPLHGARLVTIRPDADSFGAMAILTLRAIGASLGTGARERVALISRWDSFAIGSWLDWRGSLDALPPKERARAPWLRAPAEIRGLGLLANLHRNDPGAGVAATAAWLLSGTLPREVRAAVRQADHEIFAAGDGRGLEVELAVGDRIAVVRTPGGGALMLGYCHAPIVLAEGQSSYGRKLTIAQFEPGWVDLGAVRNQLICLEPGWGGSSTIIGSPQGVASSLPLTAAIDAVRLNCNIACPPAAASRL